MIVLLFEL